MKTLTRQRGSVIVMTLFAVGTALAAFTALGLGQMMWQKRELQLIADATARTAAAQIGDSDGGRFSIADQLAVRNGKLASDNLSYTCLNSVNAPVACTQNAEAVQVVVTRTIKPFFFSRSTTLQATATAEPSPIINATLTTNLVSLNTNQSAILNSILSTLGIPNLGVNALAGLNGLLGVNLDILSLSNALNVTSPESLLKLTVGQVLGNQVVPIASGELRDILSRLRIPLGDVLILDLTQADAAQARVNVGLLAINAILGSTQGNAIRLNLGSLPGGLGVKLYVVEPPQILIARQKRGKRPVGTVRTGQVKLEFNFERSVTDLLSGGLGFSFANVSLLRGGIYVQAGGAEVDIDQIVCKMPRSNIRTFFTPKNALVNVCLSDKPANFADTADTKITCGAPSQVLSVDTTFAGGLGFLLRQTLNLKVLASASTEASSSIDSTRSPAIGKDPEPIPIFNQTGPALSSLVSNLKVDLRVQLPPLLGLGSLLSDLINGLLPVVTSTLTGVVRTALTPILQAAGGIVDSVLTLVGIDLNKAMLDIQRVDCSASRLIATNP